MNLKKVLYHNWLAILYLNFKMLPFRQAIKFPSDVYHGIRIEGLSGKIYLNSENIYRGMIKIGSQGSEMFPHTKSILLIEGEWIIEG